MADTKPAQEDQDYEAEIEAMDAEDAEDAEEVEEEDLRTAFKKFTERLEKEKVGIRVHDVIIKGNTTTKDAVIEAECEILREARTVQELMQLATVAASRLKSLGIFDSASIALAAGPPELSDTANVVVEVVEAQKKLSMDAGVFTKPGVRTWTVEGSLKAKNLLGYAETWDGTGSYGCNKTSEMSAGLHYPRFLGIPAALASRLFLHTEDWTKYSSYRQKVLGFTVGLDTGKHNLSYNCKWRYMLDPNSTASRSIRSQLGHNLVSSLAYNYVIDNRDSSLRPRRGFAFASRSEIAGMGLDSRLVRFVRQELDFRYAIPIGFLNAALNVGVSAGVVLPWGRYYRDLSVPISDKFFMGGSASCLVSGLGGPTGLLGFRSRGVGPTEARRARMFDTSSTADEGADASEKDSLGGDLAVTAFADVSFDLPLKMLQSAGVHGHVFASAGNLFSLQENKYRPPSLREFGYTFRTSVGAGIVFPTKIARIEINYCEILKKFEDDRVKRGIQFSFSI